MSHPADNVPSREPTPTSHGPTPPPPDRRSFLTWATHGLGGLFGLVLAIPAIAYLIDPRNRPARAGDFRTVGKLNDLEVNKPVQAVIRDIRRDAWTLYPNDVIGRVWLVKRDKDNVDVYTTICPHLGCSVNYHPAAKVEDCRFICPCHNGTFDIQGDRVEGHGATNPAPRGMDKLEIQLVPDPADAQDKLIQVKYQNFIQGRHEKEPKT